VLPTAIIGAGPYGLSIAAHFRRNDISFRIFGRAMDSWLNHMPKGMMLKSDGFASDLYDPDSAFTLKDFCAEKRIEYSDTAIPVRLETFSAYGLAFRERLVPELEENLVVGLDRLADGFLVRLDSGETIKTRRVVLAIGITHFSYVPPVLAHLAPEFLSHSFCHHDLEPLRGRKVTVIGGGSSGIDLAYLLHEAGVDVELVSSRRELNFHDRQPVDRSRSLWEQIRAPQSGLGPGLRPRFYANGPALFQYLPERTRVRIGQTSFRAAGGWFAKERVIGHVPLVLGYTPVSAAIRNGKVRLHMRGADGSKRDITTDHVIAATGYKASLERLEFLSSGIRSNLKNINGLPVLSNAFESSQPGLYFAGVTALNTFGPVMRFAFGARFAATRLTQTIKKTMPHRGVSSAVAALSPSQNEESPSI
jgi:thioredoxin reductase